MTAKRIGFLTATLLVGTAGIVLHLYPPRMDPWHRRSLFGLPTKIENAAVGATEAELRAVYGDPTWDRLGDWHLVPGMFRTEVRHFPASVRQLKFLANRATLSVFLEQRGEEWVCSESLWQEDREFTIARVQRHLRFASFKHRFLK